MNDSLKLTGTLKVLLSDKNGVIKEQHHFKNLVVDTGKAFVINSLIAASSTPFTHIAIGSGSTPQTTSDLSLNTELTRIAFTYTTSSTSITLTSLFAPGVGTGTVVEAGIFNDPTAGTMLSRTTFPAVTKQASDQLTIIWTINLT